MVPGRRGLEGHGCDVSNLCSQNAKKESFSTTARPQEADGLDSECHVHWGPSVASHRGAARQDGTWGAEGMVLAALPQVPDPSLQEPEGDVQAVCLPLPWGCSMHPLSLPSLHGGRLFLPHDARHVHP